MKSRIAAFERDFEPAVGATDGAAALPDRVDTPAG
jgi:hypothetical protein